MTRKVSLLSFFLVITLGGMWLITNLESRQASAVTASDWRAGHIISDSLFYDNASMSVADIQAFLNKLMPACDTQGSKPASEFGRPDLTRAQYARSQGWPGPPYVCLRDYYQVPRSDKIIDNYSGTRPTGSLSAAQIIKRAADTHKVSPKALMVLLQKESPGPVPVDQWPLQKQYRNAMGAYCPDTAPCDPKYAGFYNQMMNGAERFRYYRNNPTQFRHQVKRNNSIYYHPDLARCGSSSVYIETWATAGLYNYTPYQPNRAALQNMNGTGDSCSAYGNRNFWRIYNTWFGPTQESATKYEPLDTPRWLQVVRTTYKVDSTTGERIGGALEPGTQIYFPDKIMINQQVHLRTETDHTLGNTYAIPYADLQDIPLVYEPLDTSRWLVANKPTTKIAPATKSPIAQISQGTERYFSDKISIAGTMYLREKSDSEKSIHAVIPYSDLSNLTVNFTPIEEKRELEANTNTAKLDIVTGSSIGSIPAGTKDVFDTQATVGGKTYYRTTSDSADGSIVGTPREHLREVLPELEKFPYASVMRVKSPIQKRDFATNQPTGKTLERGQLITFTHRAYYKGAWYYQTEYDASRSYAAGVPASYLTDYLVYEPLDSKRTLKLNQSMQKTDLFTRRLSGTTYSKGLEVLFTSKVTVNGVVYLRSEHDTLGNRHLGFPYTMLGEVQHTSTPKVTFTSLDRPRSLRLIQSTQKLSTDTMTSVGRTYEQNLNIAFSTKTSINGELYLRTTHDTTNNFSLVIPYRILR